MKNLSDEQRARLAAILTDLEQYAAKYLRIVPKVGGNPVPLLFNDAQRFLHAKLEQQRRDIGKVRAIVLKGRQQGVSTYYEARQFHKVVTTHGLKSYVLAHEQAASDNLFRMVARYYQHLPETLQPELDKSNAKELAFKRLVSRIEVATAGSKDTGRSGTAQLLHGSEVAFWPNAKTHLAGIGQTVADAVGTEILLESTANGTANEFHEMWQLAVSGRSEFLPVFIPWFWQGEYRRQEPAGGLELAADEEAYMEAYGLDMEQMAWRRNKIDTDFRGDVALFDQEYPASPEVAFASSSPRALIPATLVMAARKATGVEPVGRKILGVDPAEYGDDETSCMLRQGRVARKVGGWQGLGPMETVAKVSVIADREKPDMICVDATNSAGITDRLAELGYPVLRVHFGEAARLTDEYVICRDEMWGEMLKWLQDKPASIPDDNSLAAQLTSVQRSYDSKRRMKLEPKEKMKDRGLRSPDDADALALTFYQGAVGGRADAERFRARPRITDWRAR